jgi:hypothetical protein
MNRLFTAIVLVAGASGLLYYGTIAPAHAGVPLSITLAASFAVTYTFAVVLAGILTSNLNLPPVTLQLDSIFPRIEL